MAETVVCAVDDSEAAVGVLDTARGLADALDARLLAVHAGGTQLGWDWAGASVRARLAEAGELPEVRLVPGSPAAIVWKRPTDRVPTCSSSVRVGAVVCVRGCSAASRGKSRRARDVRWSSSHPARAGQGPAMVSRTGKRAWCAESTALTRRWRRPHSLVGWQRDSACGWLSCTPGRTSGRWRLIRARACRPRP